MTYLYVLQSERAGRYYIGVADDPGVRLKQHNAGEVTSTKAYQPWKQIFQIAFATLSKARQAETHLKAMKKRRSIERFIQINGESDPNKKPVGL